MVHLQSCALNRAHELLTLVGSDPIKFTLEIFHERLDVTDNELGNDTVLTFVHPKLFKSCDLIELTCRGELHMLI